MILAMMLMMQANATAMVSAPPPRVVAPEWRTRGTAYDVERLYPRAAYRKGLDGYITVECRVTEKGEMSDCAVVSETPQGEGFGEAALRMMPKFRMRPIMRDGASVAGGTVRIPLQFRMPR